MKKDDSQARLGRAGETIILNWLNKQGIKFYASVDQFDNRKDIVADNKRIEVKTQVPFISKNSFTIKENQVKKCMSVDYIYFVSVPNKRMPSSTDGKVYCIEPSKIQIFTHKTKDGRNMILIPIDQEHMKEVFTMSDEESKILQKYSVSSWN